MTMTKHVIKDRGNRMAYIGINIGFGNIIHSRVNPEEKTVLHLTDTGIIIVKDLKDEKVITAYIPKNLDMACYISKGMMSIAIKRIIRKHIEAKHHILQDTTIY